MNPTDPPRDYIVFSVNGCKHVVRDTQPQTTLFQFLRRAGMAGTKWGCGEGGYGACTVMVSTLHYIQKEIRHASVNACLTPLVSKTEYTADTLSPVPVQYSSLKNSRSTLFV